MNIVLSWDLFIVVFFVIIVAYSFIIGRDSTLKVILGTYVAMIAADAIGELFQQYFSGSAMFMDILKMAAVGNETEATIFVKVLVFILFVILFAVKGAFEVETTDDRSAAIRMSLSVIYAVMSAGLVISAILMFVSGISFVAGGGPENASVALWDIYSQSRLIRIMIQNSYLWFAVPALAFLMHSLYTKKD